MFLSPDRILVCQTIRPRRRRQSLHDDPRWRCLHAVGHRVFVQRRGSLAFRDVFAADVLHTHIKRVLAYSTISQLGYMIAALGTGAYVAATFHLVTHAFFKALLFLGSGSVIHGMEHGALHSGKHTDAQDMFNMGGLRKKMPVTFWTFLIGGMALSGFPLITAGFWSKDEILASTFGSHPAVFWTLATAAFLTAFYTMRQITLTFLGEPRTAAAAHAQENVWTMTVPLVVLAGFAIAAGWTGIPEHFPGLGALLPNWFHHFVGSMLGDVHAAAFHWEPLVVSVAVALGGLLAGWVAYRRVSSATADRLQIGVLKNKWYIDEIYSALLIKPSIWFADRIVYRLLDRQLIDGFLHLFGQVTAAVGSILRNVIDKPIINALIGDGTAAVIRSTGRNMRPHAHRPHPTIHAGICPGHDPGGGPGVLSRSGVPGPMVKSPDSRRGHRLNPRPCH